MNEFIFIGQPLRENVTLMILILIQAKLSQLYLNNRD